MRKITFKILSVFAGIFPVKLLIKLSGIKAIYPFYHIISDNPPANIKHLYPVRNIKQFKKDLDFLQKYFIASELGNNSNKPQFIISFDDGLSEVYDTITPILKGRKIPAIFFINSDFTDNINLFFKYKISIIIEKLSKNEIPDSIKDIFNCKNHKTCKKILLRLKFSDNKIIDRIAGILKINFKDYLKTEKPYLSKTQISELVNKGFKIGAHSINHPLFSEITLEEQLYQTKESISFMQNNFKIDKNLFAFPFSDDGISDAYFKTVFKKNIVDYTFGTAGIKHDIFEKNIQRIPIEQYGLSAKRHIKTELFLYIIKKIFSKNIVKR